jgi:hypothetical protein
VHVFVSSSAQAWWSLALEKPLDLARLCTAITRLIRPNRIAATEKVD